MHVGNFSTCAMNLLSRRLFIIQKLLKSVLSETLSVVLGPSGATCIFMTTVRYWCYMNIRNLSNNAKEEAMTSVRYLQDN